MMIDDDDDNIVCYQSLIVIFLKVLYLSFSYCCIVNLNINTCRLNSPEETLSLASKLHSFTHQEQCPAVESNANVNSRFSSVFYHFFSSAEVSMLNC